MRSIPLILASALLLTLAIYRPWDEPEWLRFKNWANLYGKEYSSEEEVYRFLVFSQNLKRIQIHNSELQNTYQLKETQFMDLTQQEFEENYLMNLDLPITMEAEMETENPPRALRGADWRGITKVKNQGQCGSCWAFSAVGATESYYFLRKGIIVELSEQQLVDCDTNNYGCDGGYHNLALKYVASYGLSTGMSYPYSGRKSLCKQQGGLYKINGVQSVTASALQSALLEYPVAVLVDASNWSLYGGGVFTNCQRNVNHAVLAVGFEDNGNWIVKNSWGSGWGEEGHIRLAPGNSCGIQSYAYRAI